MTVPRQTRNRYCRLVSDLDRAYSELGPVSHQLDDYEGYPPDRPNPLQCDVTQRSAQVVGWELERRRIARRYPALDPAPITQLDDSQFITDEARPDWEALVRLREQSYAALEATPGAEQLVQELAAGVFQPSSNRRDYYVAALCMIQLATTEAMIRKSSAKLTELGADVGHSARPPGRWRATARNPRPR